MARMPATLQLKGVLQTGEVWLDGKSHAPDKSLRAVNHNPAGFSWGYGGSGPAQLALAVPLDILPESEAVVLHQNFKCEVYSHSSGGRFRDGTRRFRVAERGRGGRRPMVRACAGIAARTRGFLSPGALERRLGWNGVKWSKIQV